MPFSKADKTPPHTQPHLYFFSHSLDTFRRWCLDLSYLSVYFQWISDIFFISHHLQIYIWSKSFHVYSTNCHSFSKYNLRICLTTPITCLRIFTSTHNDCLYSDLGKKTFTQFPSNFEKAKKHQTLQSEITEIFDFRFLQRKKKRSNKNGEQKYYCEPKYSAIFECKAHIIQNWMRTSAPMFH